MQYPYHPNGRGFEEYYGFCSGHWGNYFDPLLEHNGRLVKGDGFVINDFTNHAIQFIDENKDKPFFVYLPLNTPHSPMQVPDRWWKKFAGKKLGMHHRDPKKENIGHVRAALAMCENIDWNVGRILKQLDDLKLAQNTIVVYFCDNGPNGFRWNGGMRGRKGSTDEGGVRSPLLIRWPGKIAAGRRIRSNAAAIDLLPTLADLAEIDVISTKPLDGVSQKRLLRGKAVEQAGRLIFSHWRGRVAVRMDHFRLDHQGRLYDIETDPGQNTNIAKMHPQVVDRLLRAVADWKAELLPGLTDNRRPFVIAHGDYPYTQIPARDGIAHGNITRSNRFPNCSFFTNWTGLDDSITWPAEVHTSGRYQVDVYYTCPKEDVGSKIELSFNGARATGTITEAHDPPLRGAAEDRVPRTESYVKDFKPLSLGTIDLKKGRGELKLRALKKPGKQVMDFRLLMLTRVADRVR